MINDPLGDMLTRIRNAQMRRRGAVSTPGSKLRARVLEVLKSEGYIRDYSQTEFGNGRTEFSIELKYYDGQPVITPSSASPSRAAACMPPSTPCRAWPTVLASPFSRRRRA